MKNDTGRERDDITNVHRHSLYMCPFHWLRHYVQHFEESYRTLESIHRKRTVDIRTQNYSSHLDPPVMQDMFCHGTPKRPYPVATLPVSWPNCEVKWAGYGSKLWQYLPSSFHQ